MNSEMKKPYKVKARGRILKLKDEVDKSIEQIGKKEVRKILENYFGLSPEESGNFINIIENLDYKEIGHHTIPEKWFFEPPRPKRRRGKRGKMVDVPMTERINEIKKEYEDIKYAIEQYRNLPDDLKKKAIKKWCKDHIGYEDRDYRDYVDGKMPGTKSADEVSYLILSKRWMASEETIRKYVTR
jgi:vacuolar-type H+-ATPase subunit H